MGTEIIPIDKKKRDIDKAGLRDRGENHLARILDSTPGNDFIRAAVEIRTLSRKRNEISANLAQHNEKESDYIAPQVKQPDKLFSSDDKGVIFDRRPEIFQETSLDLAPLEFDKQKALQSNVIAFTPTPLESFDVKPLSLSSSFNPLESPGLENDFLASIDFPVDIGVNNALEPISLNVDDSELLVESLGKRLALHQESSLAPQTFKVDLVHNGQSFKISPLEVEPMDIEDVIEAPLEVQVNMLVKGAALLEKRKHDPPPLLRREGRTLEREKGQILRALDEIIDRGTMRAGELIAGRWGKRGLSFAGMTGLALASSACAGRSVPIPLNTLEPTISAESIVPADLPEPTAEQLSTPDTASITSLYPTTDEGFMLDAGGLENAEERIRELGAGGDIEKMKGMLIAEMNRTGINPETIEWDFSINEQADNPSWTMWPKDRVSGHYLLPKLTTGSDEGQLIRSGNLFVYLDREIGDDFFDLVELQNLQGSLGVEQRIVPDDSGWFVPGAFATDGEILEWFSVDRDEWEQVTSILVEERIVTENNMVYSEQESGKLNEVFPEANVYRTQRGDLVVIDSRNSIRLAGQTVDTKYGSYTLLVSGSHYQNQIDNLLNEDNVDTEQIFKEYPSDWISNNQLREELLKTVSSLSGLQGFRSGGDNLAGYLNLAESPNVEEIMRVISTLIALKEGEITSDSVNLATYQPEPKDFIFTYMTNGNAIRFANALPTGLADPNDPTFLMRYSASDIGFRTVETDDGVFINAIFMGSKPSVFSSNPEIHVYNHFTGLYIESAFQALIREIRVESGASTRFEYNDYFTGQFAKLFSNPNVYNSLTAFDPQRSPIKPPYSGQENLQSQNWLRYGISEIVEVDLSKFN